MQHIDVLTIVILVAGLVLVSIGASKVRERRRRRAIEEAASALGLSYRQKGEDLLQRLHKRLPLFDRGHSKRIHNVLEGQIEDIGVAVFDYRYTVGSGKHQSIHHQTVVHFTLSPGTHLPRVEVSPESLLHKVATSFGYQDIDFPDHPEFSKRFLVRGKDESSIRGLLTPQIMDALVSHPKRPTIQTDGDIFLYCRPGKRAKPEDLDDLLREAFQACTAIA